MTSFCMHLDGITCSACMSNSNKISRGDTGKLMPPTETQELRARILRLEKEVKYLKNKLMESGPPIPPGVPTIHVLHESCQCLAGKQSKAMDKLVEMSHDLGEY